MTWRIEHGDCRDLLPSIPDASVDAVITNPPYPCIRRPYGQLAEAEWHHMMDEVVAQVRRVLKPSGSAVFVLQPNSRRVGEMRLWAWEFLVRTARVWNLVRDVYWWNHAAIPTVHARRENGLLRPSVKLCLWFGPPGCWRDQDAVLWTPSGRALAGRLEDRCLRRQSSGHAVRTGRTKEVVLQRGGSTRSTSSPSPTPTVSPVRAGTGTRPGLHADCATGGSGTSARGSRWSWTLSAVRPASARPQCGTGEPSSASSRRPTARPPGGGWRRPWRTGLPLEREGRGPAAPDETDVDTTVEAVPLHLKQANEFVRRFHRHSLPCVGCKFALGCEVDGRLVGVAIAGRPVARRLDDGRTLEVLRVCSTGEKNVNSFLYSRLVRIARMMGYRRIITYTLEEESGASLRAVGARVTGRVEPQEWSVPSRPRKCQNVYKHGKVRWEL